MRNISNDENENRNFRFQIAIALNILLIKKVSLIWNQISIKTVLLFFVTKKEKDLKNKFSFIKTIFLIYFCLRRGGKNYEYRFIRAMILKSKKVFYFTKSFLLYFSIFNSDNRLVLTKVV